MPKRQLAGDRLYRELRRTIADSVPGAALMSERQLAARFAISVGTVRRVLADLVAEGLVEKVHGKGNLVREVAPLTAPGTIVLAEAWTQPDHPFFSRKLQGILAEARRHEYHLEIVSIRQDNPERHSLLATLQRPEVLGLIYPYDHPSFLDQVRQVAPTLPIVSDLARLSMAHSCTVSIDYAMFAHRAIREHQDTRTKTIAVVHHWPETALGAELALGDEPKRPKLKAIPATEATSASLAEADLVICDDDHVAQQLVDHGSIPGRMVACTNVGNNSLPAEIIAYEVDGYAFGRLVVRGLHQLLTDNLGHAVSLTMAPLPRPNAVPKHE